MMVQETQNYVCDHLSYQYFYNTEHEHQHQRGEDIMAAQNTMNLYYDDLVRLQGLMANMITDPQAEVEDGPGDYSDY